MQRPIILKKDMTVITRSGSIGNMVYVNDYLQGVVGSDDLIRIVADKSKIPPGYLFAYLSSIIGQALIKQNTYGSVIQHIEAHHLYDLPVPILSAQAMNQIHQLIEEASNLRSVAQRKISQAVESIDRQYQVNSSRHESVIPSREIQKKFGQVDELRLEASFYSNEALQVDNLMAEKKAQSLSTYCVDIRCSTLRKRCFVKSEFGMPLITGQWLNKTNFDGIKYVSNIRTKNIAKETIQHGETLITVAGTIGVVEYAFANFYENAFADQHLIRIFPDKTQIHPGYIYAFLKSKIGQIQVQRFKSGSVIQQIYEQHIGSIFIPLPEDKGNEIGEIINSSYSKLSKADQNVKKAIKIVEQELS